MLAVSTARWSKGYSCSDPSLGLRLSESDSGSCTVQIAPRRPRRRPANQFPGAVSRPKTIILVTDVLLGDGQVIKQVPAVIEHRDHKRNLQSSRQQQASEIVRGGDIPEYCQGERSSDPGSTRGCHRRARSRKLAAGARTGGSSCDRGARQ